MKVLILAFSTAISVISITCTGILEPDMSAYNKVALSSNIDNNRHIIVVDCNDRYNYEIISPPEHSAWDPVYSPNKRYILYGDSKGIKDGGYRLKLYDTYTDEIRDWPHPDFPPPAKLLGDHITWDLDSRGFYMCQIAMGIPVNILHMNIITNQLSIIYDGFLTGVVGIKDSETLIVLSNNTPVTGLPTGYYYMNKRGEFLGSVPNNYLRYEEDENGKSTRIADDLEYYPHRGFFVFSLVDTVESGKRICVSNLDGTYFEELSHGYLDANPTFNYIDNVVYFDRMEIIDSRIKYHPIMGVNLETKRVDEFFKANWIPGALEVTTPNF